MSRSGTRCSAVPDLPRAGHARREVQAAAVAALDAGVLVEHQRARADEAHVAAEHVDELRHLVERVAAQEASDARDPRVVRDLEHAVPGVAARGELGAGGSAPSYIVRNLTISIRPLLADARLAEEHRPRLSRRMATATAASGDSSSRPMPEPTMSTPRLTARDERLRPNRWTPSRTMPSTWSNSTRADDLAHARQDRHVGAHRLRLGDAREDRVGVALGPGTTTMRCAHGGRSARGPSARRRTAVRRPGRGGRRACRRPRRSRRRPRSGSARRRAPAAIRRAAAAAERREEQDPQAARRRGRGPG